MVEELLVRISMEHCNPVATPTSNYISYNNIDDYLQEDVRRYREAIGRLLWMSNITRLYVSYEVSIAARYREEFRNCHWQLVKRIIRYLKGTRDLGIVH